MSLHKIVRQVNEQFDDKDLDSLLSFNLTQKGCSVATNMSEVILSYPSETPPDQRILDEFISEVERRLEHLYDIRDALYGIDIEEED